MKFFQEHPYSNICHKSWELAKIEIVSCFPGFSKPTIKFSARLESVLVCEYHISKTAIQKVTLNQRSHLREVSRWNLMPGTTLPAWQTELQKETLSNDWSKAKNNTSCDAGMISKLYAYCKSQNENSGLTAQEMIDNYCPHPQKIKQQFK